MKRNDTPEQVPALFYVKAVCFKDSSKPCTSVYIMFYNGFVFVWDNLDDRRPNCFNRDIISGIYELKPVGDYERRSLIHSITSAREEVTA